MKNKKALQVLTTQELRHMPKPEWLVEDMVAEKSTTVIYGDWGVGKSFFALDMVLTATTGADWFGGRAILRPLKTLYVVAEGAAWWSKRIDAFEKHRAPIDEDMVRWIPQPVALFGKDLGDRTPDGVQELEAVIDGFRPDLLVIDTWVRCTSAFGMSENDAGDTATVIRELDRLRDEYQVTPVIVHHPSRQGTLRGSGNLEASVERVIKLELATQNDRFHFNVIDQKGNHIRPFDQFQLQIEDVAWEQDGEVVTGAVLREGVFTETEQFKPGSNAEKAYVWLQANPGEHKQSVIAAGAGFSQGSAFATLSGLEQQGVVYRDPQSKLWGIK